MKKDILECGERKLLIERGAVDSRIVLEEGARLTYVLFSNEGWDGVPRIVFDLKGKESEVTFLGFLVGRGTSRFAFETVSNHLAPQTKAHFLLRAAMFDESAVDYKGNLVIPKGSQRTDTYLAHHTLLLSDKTRARTLPSLEIEADDVKAGHAATIGKVDKELMFYLTSRGISPGEAESMLIAGFFETQLRMIPEEETLANVREAVMASLPSFNSIVA
jgi:Fe-S cluster assembly protein SufD